MTSIILQFLCAVLFSVTAVLNATKGHMGLMTLNILTVICFFLAGALTVKNYKNK